MSKKTTDERGFFIVLILGGIAIVAVVTILIMHQYNTQRQSQLEANAVFQATNIINNLANHVKAPDAWLRTVSDAGNANLACLRNGTSCAAQAANAPTAGTYPLTTPGGSFSLYGKDGSVVRAYPNTNTTKGFTMSGEECPAAQPYNNTVGNDACPFHAVLYWYATCGATVPCNSYTVSGYLLYRPKTKRPFTSLSRPEKFSFSISKNATGNIYSCCSIGCVNASSGNGIAYATSSVFSTANCFPGSSEIGNDFCDSALVTVPYANEWTPNGTNTVTAGECAQGPPSSN